MSDETKRDESNPGGDESNQGDVRRGTRRDLLKIAGVVAGAAVAGKLASADTASASDGQPLVVAANNSASNIETGLTTSGIDAPAGFRAFKVIAPNFDYGVSGEAKDYGVVGTGAGGVLGLGTVGGVFSGSSVAINLDPQGNSNEFLQAQAFKGDLAVDPTGALWFCTSDGTPSTGWIKISHGGSRFLATPQRAYDTRDPGKSRLTASDGSTTTPRVIPVGGLFGVPSNAVGIFGTLSIVNPDLLIFASLWPQGAFPGTANILANPGGFISTSFSVGLNSNGSGTILIGASGATDAIIDVAGYVL
jgi:hypothetical protein